MHAGLLARRRRDARANVHACIRRYKHMYVPAYMHICKPPPIHPHWGTLPALAWGLGDDAALWSHFALDAHGVRCLAYSRKSATLMEALARLRAVDSLMKVRPKWKCIDSMEKVRRKNLRTYYFHIFHGKWFGDDMCTIMGVTLLDDFGDSSGWLSQVDQYLNQRFCGTPGFWSKGPGRGVYTDAWLSHGVLLFWGADEGWPAHGLGNHPSNQPCGYIYIIWK